MSKEATKAANYIRLLEDARCRGQWQEIPELIRKVEKHAPDRKCLTLSARAEAQIAIKGRPKSVSKEPDPNLTQLVPVLEAAAQDEKRYPEEAYQAQACVAWLFWSIQDPGRVLAHVPHDTMSILRGFKSKNQDPSRATKLCAIRSACIEASILEAAKETRRAVQVYESILPYLENHVASRTVCEEYREWTEQLLINFCLATCVLISETFDEQVMSDALVAFRAWMKFWDGRPEGGMSPKNPFLPKGKLLRRIIWRRYHEVLARVIQYGEVALSQSPGPRLSSFCTTRLQQMRELRRVQHVYEGFIMQEIRYPKADEHDVEVEEWVQEVMGIWYILQSDEWMDEDLGEGGKDGLTREVLEILYRATTKTFHSVSTIRHQSTLYYALAEYEMALNTFNTYFDLIFRAKKRIAKSGKLEPALDNDEIILLTITESIHTLSAYGTLAQAQKAVELGDTLEEWLVDWSPKARRPTTHEGANQAIVNGVGGSQKDPTPAVRLQVIGPLASIAFSAMGIAKASLARLSFDASERNVLQDRAISLLKHALSAELGDNDRPGTLYALALLLAEQRDLSGSTAAAKLCLQVTTSGKYQSFGPLIPQQVRRPIEEVKAPLMSWHLLSLQLSAGSQFDLSLDTAEAGITQETPDDAFESPEERSMHSMNGSSINGSNALDNYPLHLRPNTKLSHLQQTEIDALLQLKMTQLTLIEICDGSDAAVNMSGELLNFHSRCYETIDRSSRLKPEPQAKPLPKSSSLRSIRGSLFGRNKHQRKGIPTGSYDAEAAANRQSSLAKIDEDGPRDNPRIHVTHPSSGSADFSNEQVNGPSRGSSISKLKQAAGLRKRGQTHESNHNDKDARAMTVKSPQDSMHSEGNPAVAPSYSNRPLTPSQVGVAVSAEGYIEANGTGERTQPSYQSSLSQGVTSHPVEALPSPPRLSRFYTRPEPRLSLIASQRRANELLVEIWTFIAGLYRRTGLIPDAEDALRQAQQVAAEMELEVSKTAPGYEPFYQPTWGRAKTIERIFADILTEKAQLARSRDALLEAYNLYEEALTRFPDHPQAIVLLSDILLDYYEEKIFSLYPPEWDPNPLPPVLPSSASQSSTLVNNSAPKPLSTLNHPTPTSTPLFTPPLACHTNPSINATPLADRALLNAHAAPEPQDRIAARDRAFGLLSGLTKLGSGWNDPEAWMGLARAYQLSGEAEKAKEALWWVVELEEARPVRGWEVVGRTGYVLA